MSAVWRQMVAIIECPDCGPSRGVVWRKDDTVVTADPCAKHLRMLDRLGWTR